MISHDTPRSSVLANVSGDTGIVILSPMFDNNFITSYQLSIAMQHERAESGPQQEAVAAQEQLIRGITTLLESRGIDAQAVLARNRRIRVSMDYFYDDDLATLTPEALSSFLSSVYVDREVGLKELTVSMFHDPKSKALTSSIDITVRNLDSWRVERERVEGFHGIIVPLLEVVIADYLELQPFATPLRYRFLSVPLYQWFQSEDWLEIHREEETLRSEVVSTIAALLPDQPLYLRRLGQAHRSEHPNPDLILPPPYKLITVD